MTRLYRVVPWREDADAGEAGHPLHIDVSRQGSGRADNPRHYQALYVSESPQVAVGEAFGDLYSWTEAMFVVPWLDGAVRALATFEVEKDPSILDLDDPQVLLRLGARPTDVVGRDRERTRELALSVWLQREWHGLQWWSWWRPAWRNQVLWSPVSRVADWPLRTVQVDELSITHPSVRLAAEFLRRRIA